MNEVSLFRLYLLRALYLLITVGLMFDIWPQFIYHAKPLTLWHGVGISLLTGLSLLAVVGLRYPLKMLPLLFFEMLWKAIWLIAVALPLWSANQMDPDTAASVPECLMGIIVPIVIPWGYVWRHYVRAAGDSWL